MENAFFGEDSGVATANINTRYTHRSLDHAQDVVFLQILFHKGWGSNRVFNAASSVPRRSFFFCVKNSFWHGIFETILNPMSEPLKSRV